VPGAGPNRGFAIAAPADPGVHTVCAYAIDDANVTNPLIGCRAVEAGATPIGNVEGVRRMPGGVLLTGWAIDRSRTSPVTVHAYVDGSFAGQAIADRSRPDVGAAYPAYGPSHGFEVFAPVSAGQHQLCVYAIDDQGTNPSTGCRSVSVGADAVGNLESIRRPDPLDPYTVELSGWALDLETAGAIDVHAYRSAPYPDGVFAGMTTANLPRGDIAATFPGYGQDHGFRATLPYPAGRPQMCVHAISQGQGSSSMIGCRTPPSVAPFGNLEVVDRPSTGELRVKGWALDADTTDPIAIHVYLGGPVGSGSFGGAFIAEVARPDVASRYPGYGERHGFDIRLPSSASPSVYVYLIDVGGSQNPLLGSGNA